MQTKQFTGDTIDEVLGQVRGEFGDEAVILETRNVVRGGFAGFFGRSGIEVTAADRMPGEQGRAAGRALDILDTAERPADGASANQDFLRSLGRHLEPAAAAGPGAVEAAATAATAAAADPADEHERARAIIEAARAAVREAAADTPAAEALPAGRAGSEAAAHEVMAMPREAAGADDPVQALPAAPAAATPPGRPLPLRAEVAALRDQMVAAGVEERRLESLLDGFTRSVAPFLGEEAPIREAVRDYLAARLPVVRDWRPWRTAHTIAMVGQSGVGKTATALKIAGRHAQAGMSVAVVGAGPGPRGPLLDWARSLDLTVVEAPDAGSLADAIARLCDRDLIVVDTPGCSHTAPEDLDALRALVEAAGADEVHLVLPAATPAGDLGDLQGAFRPVGISRITITKLDETRHFGAVLNAPMRIGRPLAYIADGASLPEAIAPADPRLIAELLLP